MLPDGSLARCLGLLPALLTVAGVAGALAGASARADSPDPRGSYVVLISAETYAQQDWAEVARTLRRKYDGALVIADSPAAALPALRDLRPRYICWVARPAELGRDAIVGAHRALRRIDDDPYTDAIWGVLTGYTAEDAQRIAGRTEPLVVRRALSGTSALALDKFDEGIEFSEGRAGGRWIKKAGGPVVFEEDFPVDSTQGLVDAFNDFKPEMFVTSGHATEHNWQIGYNYKDGYFKCADGQLYGEDTQGRRHDIQSPNSKAFLGVGNCLIGNIPESNCMALAMMHTAGVDQMIGYTAVTFFGYMGWGTLELFNDRAGRYTLAEAQFAVNQALVHELQTRFPSQANIDFAHYDHRKMDELFTKNGLTDDQLIGLLWDRDVLAFYGDPAWKVVRPTVPLPWETTLRCDQGTYTLTVKTLAAGKWSDKPLVELLPQRIGPAVVQRGEECMPVITDDFILLPLRGAFESGKTYELVFAAKPADAPRTSAGQKPIIVEEATPATHAATTTEAIDLPVGVPDEHRTGVARALSEAGKNAAELRQAIENAQEGHRPAVCFLIANMPPADCRTLSAAFLLEDVTLAYQARASQPWAASVPEALFLNYVLPYASINERRDAWRARFTQRCAELVKECKTPAEAACKLNETIFKEFGVSYHASKRPKPDQSPLESIEAGFASCTGLAVMLIDACRAVGVPARFVGTPQWTTQDGNHSWVEIWDGQWHFLGAFEPDPRGVDHAWFTDQAAKADADSRIHSIYAASFRRTGTHFPLVWDMTRVDVPAVNITRRYTDTVDVAFEATGTERKPVSGALEVRWSDELYAVAQLAEDANETTLRLPRNTLLGLTFTRADGAQVQRSLVLDAKDKTTVMIDASDFAASARRYTCTFAQQPPEVDGRLDDPAWQAAPWSDTFVDIQGLDHPKPTFDTRMKMTWDATHLYIAAQLDEPHLWGTLTNHDDIVYYDNDFEIFIDPDGDSQAYYEIEINALNTIFDLFLVRRYIDGGPALHDWDMRDLRHAVHLDGTLNDPRDTDKNWTVEFALPWRSLQEASRVPSPPTAGDTWRMNFSRVEWHVTTGAQGYQKVPGKPEENWVWSPQGVINMHLPATWGYVTFAR